MELFHLYFFASLFVFVLFVCLVFLNQYFIVGFADLIVPFRQGQVKIQQSKLTHVCLFVCLFKCSLQTEIHFGPDGTRLTQNAQARLKKAYAGHMVCGIK